MRTPLWGVGGPHKAGETPEEMGRGDIEHAAALFEAARDAGGGDQLFG